MSNYTQLSEEQLKTLRNFTNESHKFLNRSNVNHFIDYLTDLDSISTIDLFKLLNVETQNAQAYKDSVLTRIQNATDDDEAKVAKQDLFELNRHFDPSFVYLIDATTGRLMSNSRLSGRISHIYSILYTYEKHFTDLAVYQETLASIQDGHDYQKTLADAQSVTPLHLVRVADALVHAKDDLSNVENRTVDPENDGNDYDYDYGYTDDFDEDVNNAQNLVDKYEAFGPNTILENAYDDQPASDEVVENQVKNLLTVANRIENAVFPTKA